MFSLESPHRGDSNVNKEDIIFIMKQKSPQIILNLQLRNVFPMDSRMSKKQPW